MLHFYCEPLKTYISSVRSWGANLAVADVQLLSLFSQSAIHRLHQLRRATPSIQLTVKVLHSLHQTVYIQTGIYTTDSLLLSNLTRTYLYAKFMKEIISIYQ